MPSILSTVATFIEYVAGPVKKQLGALVFPVGGDHVQLNNRSRFENKLGLVRISVSDS